MKSWTDFANEKAPDGRIVLMKRFQTIEPNEQGFRPVGEEFFFFLKRPSEPGLRRTYLPVLLVVTNTAGTVII